MTGILDPDRGEVEETVVSPPPLGDAGAAIRPADLLAPMPVLTWQELFPRALILNEPSALRAGASHAW